MGVLPGVLRGGLRPRQPRRGAVHAAKALIGAALCAALCAGAWADSHPSALRDWLPAARPAGSARLTFWGLPVYEARLWVAPDFRQAAPDAGSFALELAYLRDFKAADIARRSLQEMRRAGDFSAQQAQRWQAALERVLPDVREGDRLTGVHRPGQGVTFLYNGRPAGEIDDAQFARLFFAIWLGPQTSEPDLRRALLAGTAP